MSRFKFAAEFEPGERVVMVDLKQHAVVEMVRIDEGMQVDYFVVWWADGKRNDAWLRGRELVRADA